MEFASKIIMEFSQYEYVQIIATSLELTEVELLGCRKLHFLFKKLLKEFSENQTLR